MFSAGLLFPVVVLLYAFGGIVRYACEKADGNPLNLKLQSG